MKKLLWWRMLIAAFILIQTSTGLPAELDSSQFPPAGQQYGFTVKFRARIFSGERDENIFPIRDTRFYLLKVDLVDTLLAQKLELYEQKGTEGLPADPETKREQFMEAILTVLTDPPTDDDSVVALLIENAVKKNTLISARTNDQGEGKLSYRVAGKYFLFGTGKASDKGFLWHVPVQLKDKDANVEIDQYNAEAMCDLREINPNFYLDLPGHYGLLPTQ